MSNQDYNNMCDDLKDMDEFSDREMGEDDDIQINVVPVFIYSLNIIE